MKVLLTGASSFTGFWFALALKSAGAEVVTPLRGSAGAYEGVRAERVRRLAEVGEIVADCAFGGPAFLDLVGARDFDVLCHHAAEVGNYRSPDFDVAGALAANTRNIRQVLTAMQARGLKALVATGSVFEPDEGAGPRPRRAFSPYGLSKGLTFQTLRHWGEVLGLPVAKFVIANPFGPFEEPRFVAHVVKSWAAGEAAEVRTPTYLRDNIHVDLLAAHYARFVAEAAAGRASHFGPCGYLETQGAFAERLARELAPRLGLEGRVTLLKQTDFDEPLARLNGDAADPAALGWSEDKAWDALAEFYRARSPAPPPRPAAAPLELRGAVDILDHTHVTGWVTAVGGANPRFARVSVDGVELGAIRADRMRPDLARLGISDGRSGYRFDFPGPLDAYADHVVRVDDRDSGRLFGPAPVTLKRQVGGADAPFAGERDFAAVQVGSASYDAAGVTLTLELFGKAATFGAPISPDATFEALERKRIENRYYSSIGLEVVRCRVLMKPRDGAQTVLFGFAEAETLAPGERVSCGNLVPARLPDYVEGVAKENMERVSGPGEQAGRFAAGGLATAHRIDSLVRLHFGRGIGECGRCLDWGVGSGRVAAPMKRYVAPQVAMAGSDVDVYNIAFDTAHYRDIAFVDSPFLPPLPFEDGAFGVIYGVSVFTHLIESVQLAWLAELRRLVPAGAPVVVSVHNDFAALRTAEVQRKVLPELVTRGISDAVADGNLGPKLAQADYYRATFHTRKYLNETWTRDFDILHIHPCANGATQDFVVLRAR